MTIRRSDAKPPCATAKDSTKSRDPSGRSPLHYAALANNVQTGEQLLAAEEDSAALDQQRFAPFRFTAQEGSLDIAQYIADLPPGYGEWSPAQCREALPQWQISTPAQRDAVGSVILEAIGSCIDWIREAQAEDGFGIAGFVFDLARLAPLGRPDTPSLLSSAVGVLGMSGGGVDDPHGAIGVVDHVPYAAATGDLILPLFKGVTIVRVVCEISAKSMLSLVVGPGTRFGA